MKEILLDEEIKQVKFYSVNDLASYYEVEKILPSLKKININKPIENFNHIIELWNILQYLDAGFYPPKLDEDEKRELDELKLKLPKIICTYLNKHKTQIEEDFETLGYDYISDFWHIIARYNCFILYPKEILIQLIKLNPIFNLPSVLEERKLVEYLDEYLSTYLSQFETTAELLLNNVIESQHRENKAYHFPKSLTIQDKEGIIIKYINGEQRNLNYLRVISNLRNSDQLSISDKTRLLCKRAEEEENQKILEKGEVISRTIELKFDYSKDFPLIDNSDTVLVYNLGSLKNHELKKELEILFQSFKFINRWGGINSISYKNEESLYDIFGFKNKSDYRTTHEFFMKNKIALMQFSGFEKGLEFFKTDTEELFQQIVSYINETLGCSLIYNRSQSGSSTLSKLRHLLAEQESIIKQYNCLVMEGSVDQDLINISSDAVLYSEIPSLIGQGNKYVSLNCKNIEFINFQKLLSSENTTFYRKIDETYYSLYIQLIKGEDPEIKYERQKEYLNEMVKKDILMKSNNGKYIITPLGRLLYLLYHVDFVEIDKLPYPIQLILPELHHKGIIEYSSHLLHKEEADYFNYWLNKKDFSNGYDLRNKYMHGSNPLDESQIENDYLKVKFLFCMLLLKIIEDTKYSSAILPHT